MSSKDELREFLSELSKKSDFILLSDELILKELDGFSYDIDIIIPHNGFNHFINSFKDIAKSYSLDIFWAMETEDCKTFLIYSNTYKKIIPVDIITSFSILNKHYEYHQIKKVGARFNTLETETRQLFYHSKLLKKPHKTDKYLSLLDIPKSEYDINFTKNILKAKGISLPKPSLKYRVLRKLRTILKLKRKPNFTIVICGPDGTGKSTLAKSVSRNLKTLGFKNEYIHAGKGSKDIKPRFTVPKFFKGSIRKILKFLIAIINYRLMKKSIGSNIIIQDRDLKHTVLNSDGKLNRILKYFTCLTPSANLYIKLRVPIETILNRKVQKSSQEIINFIKTEDQLLFDEDSIVFANVNSIEKDTLSLTKIILKEAAGDLIKFYSSKDTI
ncbi:hypothetical protein [Halobacteriovorax sp.]|uniref:hypothetical protein n=1 Tax=Halobacteriovorax sp. TaxID=2020862 RepID=UPI003AF28846